MEQRYFQWVVGERRGEVLVFDSIEEEDGTIFINFKDGSRINELMVGKINADTLDGKYMAEVESPDNVWSFRDEWVGREEEKWEINNEGESVCVIPFNPGRKIIHLIPPRKSSSSFGNIANSNHNDLKKLNNLPEIKKTDNSSDPVYIMMDKSKKIDTEVSMTLTISLPSQSLYDVVSESFEDGDNKALEYIIENIDINYNIIVSNLPYIPTSRIPILENSVKNFESVLEIIPLGKI
jgi:hypothetical protein